MADIHRTRTIAARPQEIWDVLADFGSISSWADNVDHSCVLFSGADGTPVGTARRVQVKRDTLVERITEFDPPHALAYDVEGLPRRLRRVTNRWTLAARAGDSTAVTLTRSGRNRVSPSPKAGRTRPVSLSRTTVRRRCSPGSRIDWRMPVSDRPGLRPDVIVIVTDEERAVPPYEASDVLAWRDRTLAGRRWFDEHGVSFRRHYTGSLACVPSRPTIFTGQYPDLHGVTQTDGIGKTADDSRMRWLRQGEVPTLGNWFRAAGYDTHYDGKWHISHADLIDPATGRPLPTNDDDGVVDPAAVRRYLDADPLGAVWLFGMGRSRAARGAAGQRRRSPRPPDRRPHRRVAHRPLRPPSRRRPRRAAPVPVGRQLREPPRHRAVPRRGRAEAR